MRERNREGITKKITNKTGESILGRNCRRAVLAAALSVLFLSGCGGASESSDRAVGYENGSSTQAYPSSNDVAGGASYDSSSYKTTEEAAETDWQRDAGTGQEDLSGALSERKLIRTVNMEVETKEFDQLMDALEQQVQGLGGYIESMDSYNGSSYSGSRSNRHASLTLRIPKDRLDSFLDMVSDVGNVVRRSENVEDVTLSYVDLESHRNALRTEQDRLLELLERAETLEDILTIENRLSNLRYQLESMESRLRTMDNQVDYSTVYLSVSEVQELTPVEEPTVWTRITEGFEDSLVDIGQGIVDFAVWFLTSLPYLMIWALVVIAAVLIFRRHRRRKAERKEQKTVQETDHSKE